MDVIHCFSFNPFSIIYVPTLRSISCSLKPLTSSVSSTRIMNPITNASTSHLVFNQSSTKLGGFRPFTLNVLTTTFAVSILEYLQFIYEQATYYSFASLVLPLCHYFIYKRIPPRYIHSFPTSIESHLICILDNHFPSHSVHRICQIHQRFVNSSLDATILRSSIKRLHTTEINKGEHISNELMYQNYIERTIITMIIEQLKLYANVLILSFTPQ